MELEVTFFTWFMAVLPILALILLMIKFQWGATEAAPVALIITLITGMTVYKGDLYLIAGEAAKGVWTAIPILLIIWTAILLYQVGDQAKAFQVIKNGMSKLLPNELLLVLAMGWIFESFLQGITGFGVPVAVGAPLLMGIGVRPMYAVIIPLLGQAWGNTFGTLGAAWDALASTAGLSVGTPDYYLAALWAAAILLVWDLFTGLIICWFYGKGEAIRKGLPAVLIMTIIQGGGELVLSQVNTTLSNFIPAVISLVVLLLLGRMKMYREEWSIKDSSIMIRGEEGAAEEEYPRDMTLVQAFVPYFLLSVLTIIVLTVKPITNFLGQFTIGFSFPETSTAYGIVNEASTNYSPFAPFTHASMFLLIAAVIGLIYYKSHGWIPQGGTKTAFAKSIQMTMPSGMAVVGLVIMSKIMGGTGQTVVMAQGIAAVLGNKYLILAPFIGLLGTFMTGSNLSSNILFGDFQASTAQLLGVNAPPILGAQTAGGAIGAAVSPSKIILGTTTAGILGKEGEVLKTMLLLTMPAAIAIGLVLFGILVIA